MHSISKWCNPSHKPKHIFSWSYFQVLFTVIYSSVLIFLKKSKNDGAIRRNMLFMDAVRDSFPFYKRTVQSRTGTKITLQTALSSFLGRSHVNAWKEMYIWRAIRTHTGSSSSRSRVFTLPCSAAHDPFASGWHMKGAVSRQSSSFCLILPFTLPQSLWNLK